MKRSDRKTHLRRKTAFRFLRRRSVLTRSVLGAFAESIDERVVHLVDTGTNGSIGGKSPVDASGDLLVPRESGAESFEASLEAHGSNDTEVAASKLGQVRIAPNQIEL